MVVLSLLAVNVMMARCYRAFTALGQQTDLDGVFFVCRKTLSIIDVVVIERLVLTPDSKVKSSQQIKAYWEVRREDM